MRIIVLFIVVWASGSLLSCVTGESEKDKGPVPAYAMGTYGYDQDFLRDHCRQCIELTAPDGKAQVMIAGDFQARVMTSSAQGDTGISFGWINYELIRSGQRKKQFNPFGGEERFWLGPEGGQYALYFSPGDSFSIGNWQVPAIIDTEPFELRSSSPAAATFGRSATLRNYKGTEFIVDIERTVRLLYDSLTDPWLDAVDRQGVDLVMYASENTLTNKGRSDWRKEDGLLSVWLLGMMMPSPETLVFLPFHPGPEARSGITDSYFGKVPSDRLIITDSLVVFKCDGAYRSKIGVSPAVARPVAASMDFKRNILNLVFYTIDSRGSYVNSKWEWQQEPYKGDVVNAYNDGPLTDGSQLGPFYEIESSSPGLLLPKGRSQTYRQVTLHLQGPYDRLRQIARKYTGAELDLVRKPFNL